MTRAIEDFEGLHALNEFPAHYLEFTNGGAPAEEVLDVVHSILKDVHDERSRQGIVDAGVVRKVGGPAILAIVDHYPTRSEIHKLRKQRIAFQEAAAV